MSHEDKRQGAANVFGLYYAYLNNIGQEIGIDKAEEIGSQLFKMNGSARGQAIKAISEMDEFTAEGAAAAARKSILEDFGIVSNSIEESPQRVVVKCETCPVYNGARMAGMDSGSIEAHCRSASIGYMDALVKELNPRLKYRLRKFRTSEEDTCEEEIVLE